MKKEMRKSIVIIRNFLSYVFNREFLVFLFFLCLSGIFWLIQTLNEDYDTEIEIPVALADVPRNVVITTDIPQAVTVSVRDKGFALFQLLYGKVVHPLLIPFDEYATSKDKGVVQTSKLQKAISADIGLSTKIIAVKPERMEFYYNYGIHQKVPVRLAGNVVPATTHYLANVSFSPDSVVIYASESILDSLTAVYTKSLNLSGFSDTVVMKAPLAAIKGVKMVPEEVTVGFYPDIYTEERMMVEVTGIHVPEGKVIRTFPSKVEVKFVTGMSQLRRLHPNDFRVTIDYNEIMTNPSEKCKLRLQYVPSNVSQVRLTTTEVDYLIEENE